MRVIAAIAALHFALMADAAELVCTDSWSNQVRDQCNRGGTQDMTRCFGAKLSEADAALDKLYAELKADLVEPDALVASQRSWFSFRSAECTYQSSGYACDTGISGMCSLSHGTCQLRLTCDRVRQLREHIEAKCDGCPSRKSNER